jgi:EAL domain-containing protein (putative c-di-GMP-specific phosphodiesterase class I)/DNA-binding NarL/FixJ family response regulator
MRLLVFDEDPAFGCLVVKVAGLTGMQAAAVASAEAFRELVRSEPPDIIMLDLQLGPTDGVEQLRLLAEWHYAGTLVLLSGQGARLLSAVRAFGQGLGLTIDCVLEKPLQTPALEQLFARLQTNPQALSARRLTAAIVAGEMSLDLQPIVCMRTRQLQKLEALVRWEQPGAGVIAPGGFLAMAEADAATINALAEWVVGAAVEAHRILVDLGIDMPIAVNISAQNLQDRTLPDRLEQRLRAGGMPPDHLFFEVSETAAFTDTTLTMDVLSRLALKGFRLSIDNFGTGYGSLALLRQMPFSEIKIDRSFVSEIAASRDARAIVKSVVDLAASLDIGCVAQGVETREIADAMEGLGECDLQGFLIARPMPVEAVPAWLAVWSRSGPGAGSARSDRPAAEVKGPRAAPIVARAVATAGKMVRLSPRQTDVMRLLAEGRSVKAIARELNLGIGTVKVHLSMAYSVLGAHNRIEAIRRAEPALGLRVNGASREDFAGC